MEEEGKNLMISIYLKVVGDRFHCYGFLRNEGMG